MADYEQWEYRVATFGSSWQGVKDEIIEAALNDMGAEGWDVVGMTFYPHQLKVVAKRPLTRAVRRQRSAGDDI